MTSVRLVIPTDIGAQVENLTPVLEQPTIIHLRCYVR
ncbi:hypothetical protein SAMN04515695_0653 [Pseudovibrio sp. Tun.PSC04-5.I4]|nr:hypothetical protein SAMN04515695_0653 [Pseudovibrio sp. Tun.PSC04-5.I4]